jgi:hypothetical protein
MVRMAVVIGRRQINDAVVESYAENGGDTRAAMRDLGFEWSAVEEFAERTLAHYASNETPPEAACKGAFVLGLEVGYRIRRRERRGRGRA